MLRTAAGFGKWVCIHRLETSNSTRLQKPALPLVGKWEGKRTHRQLPTDLMARWLITLGSAFCVTPVHPLWLVSTKLQHSNRMKYGNERLASFVKWEGTRMQEAWVCPGRQGLRQYHTSLKVQVHETTCNAWTHPWLLFTSLKVPLFWVLHFACVFFLYIKAIH